LTRRPAKSSPGALDEVAGEEDTNSPWRIFQRLNKHGDVGGFNMTGWWLSPTPLKNHGVKVSWDDEIPN